MAVADRPGRSGSTDHDPLHRSATFGAGKPGTSVDPQPIEILPCPAVGEQIGEIIEAGPPVVERFAQDDLNGSQQALQVGLGQLAARAQRVDPGQMEGFVGIDVAQARHDHLVKEQGLHRRSPPGQRPGQILRCWRRLPGIGTDPGQAGTRHLIGRHHSDEAECARVDEAHLDPVVQDRPKVGVGRLFV
jgi:hypothetical protein